VLVEEDEDVLGTREGADRGRILFSTAPLVNGTPFTTRGGVELGVTLRGVAYDEVVV
jgi:hypothetical protein